MNLMFRKNFRDQKTGVSSGKGSKGAIGRHTSKRCSREQGYTPMEEHHYRTHLFFSPPRCSYSQDEDAPGSPEPRCGPMTGAGGEPLPMQSSISPAMTESDLPQPLVVRTPSVSLMKWPSSPSPTKTTTPTRQVSFNYGNDGNNGETARTLSGLDRDCFIIPVHSLDRFLPAGVPMPEKDSGWSLICLLYLEINIAKYNPLRASTYVPLPKEISDRKAIVNVQNSDDKCFAWTVLSALHPVDRDAHRVAQYRNFLHELNLHNITFPVSVKDIKKFEKQNPRISLNVFGLEEVEKKYSVVGPLYHTQQRKATHKPPATGNSLEKKTQGNLHVMEVPDPKLCVLCHLMSPLEPIDPILESPLVQPLFKQRVTAGELVNEVAQAKTAVTGMLLANMERCAEFPFITYYVINTAQTNPVMFYNNLRTASLTKFDPRATRYTAAHTLDLYTEVASICRPPIHEIGMSLTKTHTSSTGYLVSVYKVFEGDDREKFERNWLYWTGARMIYRYLPSAAGLRRISLHKSLSPKGDKMYILMCECAYLLNDVTVCALILPALRARLTGYTGIFRPLQTF